ncbi:666_t:CDS:2 [Ambispora leptoticha]|uniref:666_t:CDS:1 n=1 Tax=Ambispora leptoticha TaxID=144679 RepID=A0A9N8VRE8_9GLOM|nr:666_t:CDS:2 [Ambispora leptoticha]
MKICVELFMQLDLLTNSVIANNQHHLGYYNFTQHRCGQKNYNFMHLDSLNQSNASNLNS